MGTLSLQMKANGFIFQFLSHESTTVTLKMTKEMKELVSTLAVILPEETMLQVDFVAIQPTR